MTRFGRITEARLAAWYGEDVWEALRICMGGLRVPVPVMGIPAAICPDGRILPRIAGGAGFASLSDLISEATTGGKAQTIAYQKVGVTAPAVAATQPLWNVGNLPAAGGVGGTSGTGAVPARTATGALKQENAGAGDTLHLTTWTGASTQAGALLLYDRLWHMTHNHASALSTAVDSANRPSRYQAATTAPGNFVTSEVTTVLSATAHNITLTYVDQDGNTAEANNAQAIRVSSAVQTIALTAPQWTWNLNAADTGLRYLTNVTQSTITSVTGTSSFVIGHPLAILPMPIANQAAILDGINSAFNLVRVYDDAALALNEFSKTATGAATVTGIIQLVSG